MGWNMEESGGVFIDVIRLVEKNRPDAGCKFEESEREFIGVRRWEIRSG